jgi:Ca-activated chloride channel family protein
MAGEITLTVTPGSSVVQAQPTQQLVYVLIHAQPTGVGVPAQMPLNFGLVLDRSGSMAGSKIQNLREAVKLVISRMTSQDLASLVIFDDKVDLLVNSQPVTNSANILSQVDRITDRGGTEMSKGIQKGLEQIRAGAAPDRVSRMLLLTDGETYGDEERCKQLATECGQAGIPISALGLGDDWNSELLDAIANNSGGDVDHLQTPDKIMMEFERTLRSMQGTVARNANLTLRLVQGVAPRAAWRVIPQIAKLDTRHLSDRDVQVQLGDLERDTGQSVLVELVLQPRAAGTFRIAQAEVAYDVPAAGLIGEKARQDILLTLTDNPTQVQPSDPQIMNLIEKVSVFKLQTRALSEAQAGNIGKATQQLRAAATRLLDMGEVDLAQAAQQEATNLEQQGQMSAAGTKKLQYQTRKLTQRLDD